MKIFASLSLSFNIYLINIMEAYDWNHNILYIYENMLLVVHLFADKLYLVMKEVIKKQY